VSWVYKFDAQALKDLKKLDKPMQRRILSYLDERVTDDPRLFGKGLKANLSGLWRYRVGDYRIICQIQDGELTVLVIAVGHRKDIYDS
jgi:mRNA interferase RelE/StbE